MPINRFSTFRPSPYQSQFVPTELPWDLMLKAGAQREQTQLQGEGVLGEIGGISFSALEKDKARQQAIMKEFQDKSAELSGLDLNDPKNRKEMQKFVRDSRKQLGPTGEAGAIQSNYDAFLKFKEDTLNRKDISEKEKEENINRALGDFQGTLPKGRDSFASIGLSRRAGSKEEAIRKELQTVLHGKEADVIEILGRYRQQSGMPEHKKQAIDKTITNKGFGELRKLAQELIMSSEDYTEWIKDKADYAAWSSGIDMQSYKDSKLQDLNMQRQAILNSGKSKEEIDADLHNLNTLENIYSQAKPEDIYKEDWASDYIQNVSNTFAAANEMHKETYTRSGITTDDLGMAAAKKAQEREPLLTRQSNMMSSFEDKPTIGYKSSKERLREDTFNSLRKVWEVNGELENLKSQYEAVKNKDPFAAQQLMRSITATEEKLTDVKDNYTNWNNLQDKIIDEFTEGESKTARESFENELKKYNISSKDWNNSGVANQSGNTGNKILRTPKGDVVISNKDYYNLKQKEKDYTSLKKTVEKSLDIEKAINSYYDNTRVFEEIPLSERQVKQNKSFQDIQDEMDRVFTDSETNTGTGFEFFEVGKTGKESIGLVKAKLPKSTKGTKLVGISKAKDGLMMVRVSYEDRESYIADNGEEKTRFVDKTATLYARSDRYNINDVVAKSVLGNSKKITDPSSGIEMYDLSNPEVVQIGLPAMYHVEASKISDAITKTDKSIGNEVQFTLLGDVKVKLEKISEGTGGDYKLTTDFGDGMETQYVDASELESDLIKFVYLKDQKFLN